MKVPNSLRGGWNGHTKVITVVTLAGVVVAFLAWLLPMDSGDGGGEEGGDNSASPTSTVGPTGSSRPPSQVRYLAEMPPVTGGAFVTNGGPPNAMVIRCASGQSNDRSREVSWDIPAPYSTLVGRVAISGRMDPEHNVQLEWFADGARIFNNSTLTLDSDTEFKGELAGAQDLRVRLTCTSSAGIATLLDAAVQR